MSLRVEESYVKSNDSSEGYILRYYITEDSIPLAEVNRFLDNCSRNSYLTGKTTAEALLNYLRFLKHLRIHYRDVRDKAILEHYVKYLLGYSGETVVEMEGAKAITTVKRYLSAVSKFYRWLEDEGVVDKNPVPYSVKKSNDKRQQYVDGKFLYGQIWDFNLDSNELTRGLRYKKKQEHIKHYSSEEIQRFQDNFQSARDRVVFRLQVEMGLRIGEVLGIRINDYDSKNKQMSIERNQNRENKALVKTKPRKLPITDSMAKEIDFYIRGERSRIDKYESEFLFLNHRAPHIGKPLTPRNYLKILKEVGERTGLDPKKIRTHSGRSTVAQKLLELLHQGKISQQSILDFMGWKRIDTIEHYRKQFNSQDLKRTLDLLSDKPIEGNEKLPTYENVNDFQHIREMLDALQKKK